MKNKYIVNKGFSVRYDLKSLLLCFDYFNHGIILPKNLDYIFTRRLIHYVLRCLIAIAFLLRLYKFFYKIVELNDNAIVIFKGKGQWSSTVKLVRKNNTFKIVKIPYDKQYFMKEKEFYKEYVNQKSKIKLPTCTFTKDGLIEIEFLNTKSFQRLINEGSMNRKNALDHFNQIRKEYKKFYNISLSLIHGDMSPENLFIKNKNYYLIDFADSHMYTPHYDLYILIRSILFSFNNPNVNENMKNYSLNTENVSNILMVDTSEVVKLEKHFQEQDITKHPEHSADVTVDTSGQYAMSLKNTNSIFSL